MARVLGIDPGLRACGVAWFDGIEARAFTVRPSGLTLAKAKEILVQVRSSALPAWDLVVIEKPQVYQGRKAKGDPNDLIELAVLVGALGFGFSCPVLLPRPFEWKGQVPKEISHRRIREQIPNLGRYSKDALDAVGLALWGYSARS